MKILIEGDSWGVGCWAGHDNLVYHPGLSLYLTEDNYEVTNRSKGGKRIYELLDEPIDEFDYIFIFAPDPLRGFEEEEFRKYKSYNEVIALTHTLQDKYYSEWNALGKDLYMIGGGFKLEDSIISKYSNLHIVIPSMIEYLYPNFTHPPLQPGAWVNWIDNRFSLEDIDKFITGKDEHERTTSKEFELYFSPDGYHMNHLAHKRLFEYIKSTILR